MEDSKLLHFSAFKSELEKRLKDALASPARPTPSRPAFGADVEATPAVRSLAEQRHTDMLTELRKREEMAVAGGAADLGPSFEAERLQLEVRYSQEQLRAALQELKESQARGCDRVCSAAIGGLLDTPPGTKRARTNERCLLRRDAARSWSARTASSGASARTGPTSCLACLLPSWPPRSRPPRSRSG